MLHCAGGLAIHNPSADEQVVSDQVVCGCGLMSVIPEFEDSKFGPGPSLPWSLPSACKASSMRLVVDGKLSTTDAALKKLAWDTSRPDLAMYGHTGSCTSQKVLTLKANVKLLAKAEASFSS